MRSSKWLVFIRSLPAGFDRSLTKTVQMTIDGQRARNKTLVVSALVQNCVGIGGARLIQ
jgi:hypothetical protein